MLKERHIIVIYVYLYIGGGIYFDRNKTKVGKNVFRIFFLRMILVNVSRVS